MRFGMHVPDLDDTLPPYRAAAFTAQGFPVTTLKTTHHRVH